MKSSIAALVISAILSCATGFDVPEPVFEVFHPKGLRVSIPDSDGIQSVQFLLSVKTQNEDATEMFDDPDKSEEGRWMYWNPEASLAKGDQIYYKVTVEFDDLYWNKEGEHKVEEVFSLDGNVADPEAPAPKFLGLHTHNLYRNRHRRLITEGKKSSYHSSYSSYSSPDSKPITRSSTSSTTGTFVMKPTGEVEASGYKKSETYDSTKREGEQWEITESELSPEELEELKRFIGPSFRSFSELTQGQVEEFKRLHGGSHHYLPERLRTSGYDSVRPGGAQHAYEESYFAKESSSSSSMRNQQHQARHPSSSYQQYHERQSSSGRVQPSYQPDPIQPASTNRYEEHRYDHRTTSTVAHPVPLTHVDAPDYQQEVPAVLPAPSRQSTRNYEYSQSHRSVASQSASRPQYDPSPSYLDTESERRALSSASHRRESYDAQASEDVQTVEKPKYQVESHYRGSIFRSISASRASTPQECTVWSETNYDHVTDLREIQKSISRIGCLASLAESSVKEELRLVKKENSDLRRKLENLDVEFRRFQTSCHCSG